MRQGGAACALQTSPSALVGYLLWDSVGSPSCGPGGGCPRHTRGNCRSSDSGKIWFSLQESFVGGGPKMLFLQRKRWVAEARCGGWFMIGQKLSATLGLESVFRIRKVGVRSGHNMVCDNHAGCMLCVRQECDKERWTSQFAIGGVLVQTATPGRC